MVNAPILPLPLRRNSRVEKGQNFYKQPLTLQIWNRWLDELNSTTPPDETRLRLRQGINEFRKLLERPHDATYASWPHGQSGPSGWGDAPGLRGSARVGSPRDDGRQPDAAKVGTRVGAPQTAN